MKLKTICWVAAAAVLAGCAQPSPQGAAVDTDYNVLTGGPVTGTTVQDLPSAVQETLKERAPHAEVADIDRTSRNGEVVYEITLSGSGWNGWSPKVYITETGKALAGSAASGQ